MKAARARGFTLIEIMLSLVVLFLGLLTMMKAISAAIQGNAFAFQMVQAQARATAIVEAIRSAPVSSLTCLTNTAATSWATCETDCKNNQTGTGATLAQSCMFTVESFSNLKGPTAAGYTDQRVDRSGQKYEIVYNNASPTPYRTTFVRRTGPGNRVLDVQVTIGWNSDDTSATAPNHFVTLRSGVFN